MNWLAFLALGDLDLRRRQRLEVLVANGLAEGLLDQLLEGFVQDYRRAEHAFEYRTGRLARPKAGNAGLAREPADRLIDGPREALRRKLELEL